jgi:superfamily I DNA/RNA helicase
MVFLPVACGMVHARYDLVVVDEAQDMTGAQLEMAIKACRPSGRLVIVGDDKQAIYGFRGADSGSLDRLKAQLGAAELGLKMTYRCPKRVVEIAQRVVPDFRAAVSAPEGAVERCEGERLAGLVSPRDFVLSRSNASLVKVCLSILRQGKRAYVKGRDIGAGIMSLVSKQAATTLKELEERLRVWHERESRKAMKLPQEAAEARLEFLDDELGVCLALIEDSDTVGALLGRLSRLFGEGDADSVMCSTTHRAKGLEAETVYLLEGTFRDTDDEERNIFYVAVTRAKRRLVWVSGFERKRQEA